VAGESKESGVSDAVYSLEWLPRKEAALVSGYSENTMQGLIRDAKIPVEMRPRPVWRECGPRYVVWLHMPSLLEYQRTRVMWNVAGNPHRGTAKASNTKLGTMLAEERYKRGWTQKLVSEAIGVTWARLSWWELGKSIPRIDFLVKLCELYDLPVQIRWSMVEALAWLESERRR
jgi:DNA-binding XRE family transcriptional regulator